MSHICEHGKYNGADEACGLCAGAEQQSLAHLMHLLKQAFQKVPPDEGCDSRNGHDCTACPEKSATRYAVLREREAARQKLAQMVGGEE